MMSVRTLVFGSGLWERRMISVAVYGVDCIEFDDWWSGSLVSHEDNQGWV